MKKLCYLLITLMLTINVVNFTTVVYAEAPKLRFSVINPGYSQDGKDDVGEVIVLKNLQGGSFSLAGFSIKYINSGGTSSLLLEFPASAEMIGEDLQLRLASSGEAADLSYSRSLGQKAAVELWYNGVMMDRACWLAASLEGCVSAFNGSKPMVWVREDFEALDYKKKMVSEVPVSYNPAKPGIQIEEGKGGDDGQKPAEVAKPTETAKPTESDPGNNTQPVNTAKPAETDEAPQAHCRGLQFSELLSYYEASATEQFIEFYNASDDQIILDGCNLKYKNKEHALSGVVKPGEYFIYIPEGFTLTKNPTNQNILEIIDADKSTVDSLAYYNGQKKGVSIAQMGYDEKGEEIWLATYAPTPGEENNYQKYKTCEVGKVINEETGNCVKATNIDTTLADCPEGKYRNPLTGRCKSYETKSSTSLKECAEGYERNPETNRCRKIKTNTGADYALAEGDAGEAQVNFVALAAIIVVAGIGLVYVIWQFRKEIWGGMKKLANKIAPRTGGRS